MKESMGLAASLANLAEKTVTQIWAGDLKFPQTQVDRLHREYMQVQQLIRSGVNQRLRDFNSQFSYDPTHKDCRSEQYAAQRRVVVSGYYQSLFLDNADCPDPEGSPVWPILITLDTLLGSDLRSKTRNLTSQTYGFTKEEVRFVVETALIIAKEICNPAKLPPGKVISDHRYNFQYSQDAGQHDLVVVPPSSTTLIEDSQFVTPWMLGEIKNCFEIDHVLDLDPPLQPKPEHTRELFRRLSQLAKVTSENDVEFTPPSYVIFYYLRGLYPHLVYTIPVGIAFLEQWQSYLKLVILAQTHPRLATNRSSANYGQELTLSTADTALKYVNSEIKRRSRPIFPKPNYQIAHNQSLGLEVAETFTPGLLLGSDSDVPSLVPKEEKRSLAQKRSLAKTIELFPLESRSSVVVSLGATTQATLREVLTTLLSDQNTIEQFVLPIVAVPTEDAQKIAQFVINHLVGKKKSPHIELYYEPQNKESNYRINLNTLLKQILDTITPTAKRKLGSKLQCCLNTLSTLAEDCMATMANIYLTESNDPPEIEYIEGLLFPRVIPTNILTGDVILQTLHVMNLTPEGSSITLSPAKSQQFVTTAMSLLAQKLSEHPLSTNNKHGS